MVFLCTTPSLACSVFDETKHTRSEGVFHIFVLLACPYAPAVVRAGAKWLGVTSVEEGIVARALCPEARVLIIGGVFPGQAAAAIQFQLTPVAWEPWQLDELVSAARAAGSQQGSVPVHLEIDTGMSRQGVSPGDLATIFARFGPGSPLRLEGVMTHLFAADEADGQATEEQLARLDEAMSRISAADSSPSGSTSAHPPRSLPAWRPSSQTWPRVTA